MHHGRSPRAAERLKRLQHAAAMLHCVQDTGTATCNPVNYRAGTGGVHPKNETQKQGKGCTMPEGKRRVFNREFKVSVVERILAGESGAALSRELHIRESQLAKWCRHFRRKGPDGLRRAGRPRKSLDPADLDPSSRPKGVANLAAAR